MAPDGPDVKNNGTVGSAGGDCIMANRITCIDNANGQHENPYVAISHLGWEEDGTGKTGRTDRGLPLTDA